MRQHKTLYICVEISIVYTMRTILLSNTNRRQACLDYVVARINNRGANATQIVYIY